MKHSQGIDVQSPIWGSRVIVPITNHQSKITNHQSPITGADCRSDPFCSLECLDKMNKINILGYRPKDDSASMRYTSISVIFTACHPHSPSFLGIAPEGRVVDACRIGFAVPPLLHLSPLANPISNPRPRRPMRLPMSLSTATAGEGPCTAACLSLSHLSRIQPLSWMLCIKATPRRVINATEPKALSPVMDFLAW